MRVNLIGVRRLLVSALTIALTAVVAGPANAGAVIFRPAPPPNDRIIVEIITINGSGCPPGTVAVAVSPGGESFSVIYGDYLAQVGVGSRPTDFRKNCQLNLRIRVPSGYRYAIAQADHGGFASLQRGATSSQRANFFFHGQSPSIFNTHTFRGPLVDDWQSSDVVDGAALVYVPCGEERNLNISTELRVSAGTSDPTTTTSYMSMDSVDAAFGSTYYFAWLRCP
jgi:hypothetical protein